MASTTTATEQVFETAELLEQILLQLPMEDVFCVLRISRLWQNLISSSITLKRKLWIQPLLPPVSPLSFSLPFNSPHYSEQFTLNPLVTNTNRLSKCPVWPSFRRRRWAGYDVHSSVWTPDIMPLVISKEQVPVSCRGAQLTHPPCTIVCMGTLEADVMVREKAGITLGLLEDVSDKLLLHIEVDDRRGTRWARVTFCTPRTNA